MKIFYLSLAIFFIVGSMFEFYLTGRDHKDYYDKGDFKSSVKLMLGGLLVDVSIKWLVVLLLMKLYEVSLFHFDYSWWVWVLCYLVWDLVFYFKHYLEHNVRFMWAIHVNHHSSEFMNLSTSLRSGVFKATYRYFFWLVPIGIGFPVPMFLILYGAAKVWAFFGHSQKMGKWGILEKFTVTPTHHLLHHSYNEENLNKNFGETFLVWDKLFGTFRETEKKLEFGIGEHIDHSDFKQVVFHEFYKMRDEWKEAETWGKRLKIVFGKPCSNKIH